MIKLTWNKIPTYLFFVCEKTCYTHAWTHYLECIELVTPFCVSKQQGKKDSQLPYNVLVMIYQSHYYIRALS